MALQVFERDAFLLSQRVLTVDYGSQAIVEEHLALDAWIALTGLEGQHEVKLVPLQPFHKVFHRREADGQLHLRMLVHEVDHCLGHDAAEGEGDAYIEFARQQLSQLLYPLHAVVHHIYAVACHRQQHLSGLSEYHFMAIAHEELLRQFLLQMQNLL